MPHQHTFQVGDIVEYASDFCDGERNMRGSIGVVAGFPHCLNGDVLSVNWISCAAPGLAFIHADGADSWLAAREFTLITKMKEEP